MARRRTKDTYGATIEAWLVLFAIALTVWLMRSGKLAELMDASTILGPAASFVAGLMYSTFVTTPLAIGSFIELSHSANALQIAFLGAFGAAFVDLLLAKGIRSPLMDAILHAAFGDQIFSFAKKLSRGRWSTASAVLGCILVAIPLPTDEIGVTFLGLSHTSSWRVAPFIYIADFIGIFLFVSGVRAFT